MPTQSVYGVDFSGASQAGENIWLTGAAVDDGALRVRECGPADDVLASHYDDGPTTARGPTLDALASFVEDRPDAAFGFDFPFSVPEAVADGAFGADSWREVVAAITDCEDADAFAEACVEWTTEHTDGTYLKRDADTALGAFSPYHFFVQQQTYHGITDLLAPVQDVASIVPFDAPVDGEAVVAETYPAGVLDDLGLCREGYKGTDDAHATRRSRNLDGLAELAAVAVPAEHRETYLEDIEGDALDSLIAAVAVARNRDDWGYEPDSLEGRIYV